MRSTTFSHSLLEDNEPRPSAGSNVSTADRDGWQSSITTHQSSLPFNVSESAPTLPPPLPDSGTLASAISGKATPSRPLSKSTAASAGGACRLSRGVSFVCGEYSSPSVDASSMFSAVPRQPVEHGARGIGGPRRTPSGILRMHTSSGGRESSAKDATGSALPGGEKRASVEFYASLGPERLGGFEDNNGDERAEGESGRGNSLIAVTAGGSSSIPASTRRSMYGGWGAGGGGGTPRSSRGSRTGTQGAGPLCGTEGRGRVGDQQRVGIRGGNRGIIQVGGARSNAFSSATAVGGAGIHAIRGGVGEEGNLHAGLEYRRSRAWPGSARPLGGMRGVGGGRATFRTCSDSHLAPQQQYPRSRKLHQGTVDGGVGVAGLPGSGSGSGGGGRGEGSSGANFSYYGRSRSTQQYAGRSAGSPWASRYSWLPVFSGSLCYGELEPDRRLRRHFWKERVASVTHAVATCVAKHVHVGARYGFYPLCSARMLTWLCILSSLYFISVGMWLIVEDENYLECKLNYEDKGPQNGGSRYLLERIRSDMCGSRSGEVTHLPGPAIYVYVEMEHVYQNDAQILWSRSWRQLSGEIITNPAELKECEPFITAVVENRTKILHPCGALPWNVLTDQFHFLEGPDDDDDDQLAHTPIFLNQSQAVVLEAYKGWEHLYKNPSKEERAKHADSVYFWMSPEDNDMRVNPNLVKEHARAELTADRLGYREAGAMVENAHFIQWMTAGAFGRWRKLYGKLTGPLKLPIYAYISSVYDVSAWGGKKAIVLVQSSQFGGRTLFLGIVYIVLGCILILLSVWLGWKSWHRQVERDGTADLRWQSRKRSLKKSK